MTGQPFESAAVIADELLIAMLGAGDAAEDDELGALLGVWRAELAAAFVPEPRVVAPIVRRRVSRGFVTGAVSALLVAGGGVAAAAAGGPHGALGEL
ncbi:MAG: hypothetical protein QOH89_2549, partial [Pseudonocardiales bacterium]|nr:hypothetical protein [Pseudonocardiales bacterium]